MDNCENQGHRERLRDRILQEGAYAIKDHELLELILFSVFKRKNTNPLAHRLIKYFGSLSNVFAASAEQLMQVKGVSKATAVAIVAIGELNLRCRKESIVNPDFRNVSSCLEYVRQLVQHSNNEEIYVLFISADWRCVGVHKSISSNDSKVPLDVTEVCRKAIKYNAVTVMVMHNHPHTQCFPSTADVALTMLLYQSLITLDIFLADHIIFNSRGDSYSFAKNGLMTEIQIDYAQNIKGERQ